MPVSDSGLLAESENGSLPRPTLLNPLEIALYHGRIGSVNKIIGVIRPVFCVFSRNQPGLISRPVRWKTRKPDAHFFLDIGARSI